MRPKTGAAGPSQRQLKAGETIRHALAEILLKTEIRDDDLSGVVVTVSEVKASPDMRNATAYVMPLGGENTSLIIDALNRHKKFLRGELGHFLTMKYTPALSFEADATFEQAARIDEILGTPEVVRDLKVK